MRSAKGAWEVNGRTNRRQFLAAATAGVAAAGCGAGRLFDIGRPPNILVYLADSLRAGFLGTYGGRSSTAPYVDALAKRSFVFESCYAQSCWTKPAMGSLYTGMMPRVHKSAITPWRMAPGQKVPPRLLHPELLTWAEAMQVLGYRTACFQSNPFPREEFHYDRGFEHFRFQVNETAPSQARAVRDWIADECDEPFFALIHQLDPHGPYTPEDRYFFAVHGVLSHEVAETIPKADLECVETWHNVYHDMDNREADRERVAGLSREGNRYFRMLYEGMIRRADEAFATIVRELDSQRLLDHTVVVFISDHGESFGERKRIYFHGNWLSVQELHVPMIIHLPGQREGIRIKEPVALYDLYPTCVSIAGGRPDRSLMAKPLIDGKGALIPQFDRAIMAELDAATAGGEAWSETMFLGPRVVQRHFDHQEGAYVEAFDLRNDPEQLHPLSGSVLGTESWQRAFSLFDEEVQHHRFLADLTGPAIAAREPAGFREELDALGYV